MKLPMLISSNLKFKIWKHTRIWKVNILTAVNLKFKMTLSKPNNQEKLAAFSFNLLFTKKTIWCFWIRKQKSVVKYPKVSFRQISMTIVPQMRIWRIMRNVSYKKSYDKALRDSICKKSKDLAMQKDLLKTLMLFKDSKTQKCGSIVTMSEL